ncbi:four-carbon acid sugar kinase family protein [Gracilibacillus suaedae]|uniref:four-carbon acid sugar kinase family protein n=1 Tax=Gracilibacillus suaedae TaxID=2820273 RepID=UPI001ABEBDA8|nr:four-carbon acid sugar kinase family protein [Gracilibacillus suaedae]
MKIAIIADDLTGACDTGVQLVQYGLDVSVAIQCSKHRLDADKDAIIFNTDSRALPKEEAYTKVKDTSQQIKEMEFDFIYKKIDSTMRGNIGSELNAVYDIFQPDFIFITPAHPNNGREVRNGVHYLNGVKLSETEVANDPKTPVTEANVCQLIQHSSGRRVEHLHSSDLDKGNHFLLQRLDEWKKQGISYVTVDAITEQDLQRLMDVVHLAYSSILCGSAGLIHYLPESLGIEKQQQDNQILTNNQPILFVIGSISKLGRQQLHHLLLNSRVVGVEMDVIHVIAEDEAKDKELQRIQTKIEAAIFAGNSVALYSSSDLEATAAIGRDKEISPIEISNLISEALGDAAVSIINAMKIRNLFLTGGDTAQQVFEKLQIKDYQLIGELELGVPVGKIAKHNEMITITKAGSFGTDHVMTNALQQLHIGAQKDKANY